MILGTASECHANTNGAFITLGVINALDDTTDFCVEVDFYGGRKTGEPVGKKNPQKTCETQDRTQVAVLGGADDDQCANQNAHKRANRVTPTKK